MRTKARIAALQARIDQLEAQAAGGDREHTEQRTSRRAALRLAGAAAVGGLAAAVTADPAAATDNSAVLAGVAANTATLPTGIAVAAASTVYGLGCYETGLGTPSADLGRPAIFGLATNTAFTTGVGGHSTFTDGNGVTGLETGTGISGAGVFGQTDFGFGVAGIGLSTGGVGLFGAGPGGAIYIEGASTAPPSRTGFFFSGTIDINQSNRDLWYCCQSGTPGTWRKLAGLTTAGAFHALTPTRVYDSRAALPSPGILGTGANRTVSVADGRDSNGTVTIPDLVPSGATAVAANITVTGTTGTFGYLAINPGGNTVEGASTINWFGAGQTLANGVGLTLNANRQITIICNGGGSTHFLIDISGYYL